MARPWRRPSKRQDQENEDGNEVKEDKINGAFTLSRRQMDF